MKYLITGHPRSATMYTYKLLRALGEDSMFERSGHKYTVSWKHCVDGEFPKPSPENIIKCNFDKIIHQVRHPLNVIASSTTLWNQSFEYINKYVPFDDPLKHRNQSIYNCMRSWYCWNLVIESKASWRYKIEELPKVWNKWCKELGIKNKKRPIVSRANMRIHRKLIWEDLYKISPVFTDMIRGMAIKYGYKE